MFTDLIRAAQRRARGGDSADSGFVLIYVLMVITIVTVLVGSVLVVSASSIIPSVQSSYDQAALAAAQAGIQDFIATADRTCNDAAHSTAATCAAAISPSTGAMTPSGAAYSAGFSWSPAPAGSTIRVTSTGTIRNGGLTASRTLVADIGGGSSSNYLDYGSVVQYETQAPDVVAQQLPSRTITLSPAAVTAADAVAGASGTSVHWNGIAQNAAGAAGSVNTCNSVYYPIPNVTTGRVANPTPLAANTDPSFQALLPYVDFTESGVLGGASETDYQPCQVTLGSTTTLAAPTIPADGLGSYATNDALLISNSKPGGSGPLLDQPVYTSYQNNGQSYRSFTLPGYTPDVGGQPAASSSYTPAYRQAVPGPITTPPVIPANSCVYSGPTRVLLSGTGMTVTSPQTTAAIAGSPAGCYPTSLTGGIYAYPVSFSSIASFSGVISVNNSGSLPTIVPTLHTSTGWTAVNGGAAGQTNSVFYSTTPGSGPTQVLTYTATAADKAYTPAVGDNPSTKTDGSWLPQWTSYFSGTSCDSNTTGADLRLFNCSMGGGSYSATAYTTFKNAVQTALTANPRNYQSASTLQTYLTDALASGNSADAGTTPSNPNSLSHRFVVSVASGTTTGSGCVAAVGPTSPPATSAIHPPLYGDPLIQNSDGTLSVTTQTTTSCLIATVTLQVGTCSLLGLFGVCVGTVGWGNGGILLGGGATIPQFQFTTTATTTTTTSSSTTATSQFPISGDVTMYGTGPGGQDSTSGPGDLYVEGAPSRSLALVAANDVIVTGTLAPTDPTTQGLEVVGQDNVRVYHPETCVSATSGTTAGFCPDDITGLYKTIPPDGLRPYQQYQNARGNLAGMSINAAIFALGSAVATTVSSTICPQWQNKGICGGQLAVDNYNRGAGMSTLSITGTIAQVHHGALGQVWEVPDLAGQPQPYSGYQLTERYQNLKPQLSSVNVLQTIGATSALWHVISTSTKNGG